MFFFLLSLGLNSFVETPRFNGIEVASGPLGSSGFGAVKSCGMDCPSFPYRFGSAAGGGGTMRTGGVIGDADDAAPLAGIGGGGGGGGGSSVPTRAAGIRKSVGA